LVDLCNNKQLSSRENKDLLTKIVDLSSTIDKLDGQNKILKSSSINDNISRIKREFNHECLNILNDENIDSGIIRFEKHMLELDKIMVDGTSIEKNISTINSSNEESFIDCIPTYLCDKIMIRLNQSNEPKGLYIVIRTILYPIMIGIELSLIVTGIIMCVLIILTFVVKFLQLCYYILNLF
jgi:hypothetical protein